MKLYLDDERPAPKGWHRAYTAGEAITLLEKGQVTYLSLDHDLGPEESGTGYDVCKWLEKKVYEKSWDFENPFTPPVIFIHSANPVGRANMEDSIKWMYHHFKITQPTAWDEFSKHSNFAVNFFYSL